MKNLSYVSRASSHCWASSAEWQEHTMLNSMQLSLALQFNVACTSEYWTRLPMQCKIGEIWRALTLAEAGLVLHVQKLGEGPCQVDMQEATVHLILKFGV